MTKIYKGYHRIWFRCVQSLKDTGLSEEDAIYYTTKTLMEILEKQMEKANAKDS